MSETYIIVEEHRTGLRKHYLSREDYGGSIHVNWSERKLFVGSYKEAYNFGKVIGANKRKRFFKSLKRQILSAYNFERRALILWGITHEKMGVEEYCKAGAVIVLPTGIWIYESGALGTSPDGFVQGDNHKTGITHLK